MRKHKMRYFLKKNENNAAVLIQRGKQNEILYEED